MKKTVLFFVILSLVFSVFAAAADQTFSDMPNDWSTIPLQNAVKNGLLTGADGKIMPYSSLTRAQLATIIVRALDSKEAGADLSAFTDVDADSWYAGSMSVAVKLGIFAGADGKLYPNDPVTREQVFTVLVRAFKLTGVDRDALKAFKDADSVSSWAFDATCLMAAKGYITGSYGNINPKSQITRAEFAKLMDNLIKTGAVAIGITDNDGDGWSDGWK